MKLSAFLFFCTLTAAEQPNDARSRMRAVENGLTEVREVVFADSTLPSHTVRERMAVHRVPSVAVAVISSGKIDWVNAYGAADTASLFQTASLSKTANAIGVLRLAQKGTVNLDADIRTMLKRWRFPDSDLSRNRTITLAQLLSHTAGLSTSGFRGYQRSQPLPTLTQILNGEPPANSEPVRPLAAPGTQYSYSGGGTTLIRQILAESVSPNYDSLMTAVVLRPMGMKRSTFAQPLPTTVKNVMKGYDAKGKEVPGGWNVYPELAPDGLWSTAGDIARMIVGIQRSLRGERGAVLDRRMAERMTTVVPPSGESGLGVFVTKKGADRYFYHTGANAGYRSTYYGSLTNGNGVVVLTNSDNGQPLIDEIVARVAAVYGWKEFNSPIVKRIARLPESTLRSYAGSYVSTEPKVTIVIQYEQDRLMLTARKKEQLFPLGAGRFFLLSAPNDTCIIRPAGGKDLFEVHRDGTVVITAAKQR